MTGFRRWGDIGGAVWWRQLRSDARADAVLALVVTMTVFIVAAAPRLLEHASTRDLTATIVDATPEQRNLALQMRTGIGAGPPGSPFSNVDVQGDRLRDEFVPASVQALVRDEHWVVDTPAFSVTSFPGDERPVFPPTFRFRYQTGIEERSRLVAGRSPTLADPIVRLEGADCPVDGDVETFVAEAQQDCAVVELPVFEAAITQRTADDMMVEPGDLVTLRPVVGDLSFRTAEVDPGALRFVLRISGIIELDDERLEYWYADSSLHRPRITETADFRLVYAVGLSSPDQYRAFRDAVPGVELSFTWRYLLDDELVGRTNAGQLRDDVAKIAPPGVDVITQLPELLGEHLAQRRLTVALLSLSAVGIVAAALAAIWVLTAVDRVRRRPVTSLFADRGASRFQLGVHAGRTGLVVTVPAALVGSALARALFVDTDGVRTFVPVAAVVLAGWCAVVLAGRPVRERADRERDQVRRLVAELLVIGVAVGSVLLVRRRDSSVADSDTGGFDTALAMVPVSVALAVGLVATRAAGPIAAGLGRLAERRRSATWFIGARRVAQPSSTLRTLVIAITMAAAVAAFAIAVSTSFEHHREIDAWQSVGGEARIETTDPDIPLPGQLRLRLEAGSAPLAFGTTLRFQRLAAESGGFVADVVALDVDSFVGIVGSEVLSDTVDTDIRSLQPTDADGPDAAIPALVVGWRQGVTAPGVGDVAVLGRGVFEVRYEIVGASARFPGVPPGRPTIVVDRSALRAATDDRTVAPTFAVLGGDDPIDADMQALLDDAGSTVRWTTRADRLDAVAGDPLASWTGRSVRAIGVSAVALAVVTAGAGALITAASRRRDLGILVILGAEPRSTSRLVAIELLPSVLIAAVAGTIAGAGTARLLGRHLSLSAFTGGGDAVEVVFAWRVIGAAMALLVVATILTVAATVRSLRHLDHAMLLREGEV